MRLQWRSSQQINQGNALLIFSRLVGVEHASFEIFTICRKRVAVCAASHTTGFFSTSISASSAALGVSRRIFLLSRQASRFCIGNPSEASFSCSVA
jgi:hypothetical protein